MTIDAFSEQGLLLAITQFVYTCSEDILPKEVDREQLVQNIENIYHNDAKRLLLLSKLSNHFSKNKRGEQ